MSSTAHTAEGEKILIVDDDPGLSSLLERFFTSKGYRARAVPNVEQMDRLLAREVFNLVVLDLMLPGEDGLSACRRLRAANNQVPIIMLTARSEERDELLGFELGVDEYISKPFSPKILVARIEAILRRGNAGTGEILEAAGIRVDKDAHEASVDGQPVDLSNKEFELLTYFMENQGMALSREKILNNVWNYDYFGDARTIDTHVKKLRSKLGEKGELIKTIWGMGYKFEVNA